MKSATLLLLTFFLGVSAAVGQQKTSDLARALDAVFDDEAFTNAFWGVEVVDLRTGTRIYERNAGKSFVPASNTKLYTTSAALDLLGPDYRYYTRLYVDGPVRDSVLHGNLIVRGSADPTIGSHYELQTGKWEVDVDFTRVFRDWADSLRKAGIARIEGDIIGDDDVVDDVPLGAGWSWDDETFYYAAQMSGLIFNDNVVHMHVEARKSNMPADIRWDPFNTDYITVVNRSLTVPSGSIDEGYERLRGTNTVVVTTEVPEGRSDVEEITVENPSQFFVHVLRETLIRSGIAVSGRPVDVDLISVKPDYADSRNRVVAVHTSAPLREIVAVINKPSQNLYADMLMKTLGAEYPRKDDDLALGSSAMGIEVAMQTFARAGIDTSRIQLRDGSGLSAMNLVTPEMTNKLLAYMWNHHDGAVREAFFDSLPIAGSEGTLRNRMRNSPARDRVRAKTGSLSNVSSLSGYVRTRNDQPLAFSMMANHFTVRTSAIREAQDKVVEILVRYGE